MNTTADNAWSEIDASGIDTRLLPDQMRRLIKVIGVPATVALHEARGGAPVEFPRRYPERSGLVEVIGLDAVRAITASEWAGKRITLTKPDRIHWQLKRLYARAMHGHKTKRELADELRCTTRWVQYVWNEEPIEDAESPDENRTGDLFEGAS